MGMFNMASGTAPMYSKIIKDRLIQKHSYGKCGISNIHRLDVSSPNDAGIMIGVKPSTLKDIKIREQDY